MPKVLRRLALRRRIARRPWRLRTRLGLALLIVAGPIAGLLILSHVQNLQERRTAEVQNIAAIGETLAASMESFARDLESLSFAAAIALGGEAEPNQRTHGPFLKNLRDSYDTLRLIFVTDPQGNVLASNSGNFSGLDVSELTHLEALREGAETVWTGGLIGEDDASLVVHGRVVRNPEGQLQGYLFMAFHPRRLADRLPSDLPADANVSLIDREGVVLFTTRETEDTPRSIAGTELFEAANESRYVLVESEGTPLDGDERYGAFVRVPGTGWLVGFTRPSQVVDGWYQSRMRRDAGIMVALVALGLATVFLAAARLSKPLSSLSSAAEAIARGEQPIVPIDAADADVRRLERAMETMSRAIAEREERLLVETRSLETLERVGETLATELDLEEAVASITMAALQVTQAKSVGFYYQEPGPSSGTLRLLGQAGEGFPLTSDDPLVRRTLSGEVLDVSEVGVFPGALQPPFLTPEGRGMLHSFLGIPVRSRFGELHGGLFLLHTRQGAFSQRHKLLAVGLARRAGIVVENARLYSEARKTQEELRQASMAKSEFIGVMSHELRTPITTIYGGARLLRSRHATLAKESVQEMIASIEEEAERLYRLVENLLTLARSDLYEDIEIDVLSMKPVIDPPVKQFSNRHPGRPIEVSVAPDLPLAMGEPGYLHLVLYNLISNADKYSEPGRPITIEACAEGSEVVVKVKDRGMGVAPDEVDTIFESFYRSQRTAKLAGGKGLGLTVCRRLIEGMSGRIWACNREGGGLEVCFALRAAPMIEEEEPVESEAPAAVAD